jgi:hypothetical protein
MATDAKRMQALERKNCAALREDVLRGFAAPVA